MGGLYDLNDLLKLLTLSSHYCYINDHFIPLLAAVIESILVTDNLK